MHVSANSVIGDPGIASRQPSYQRNQSICEGRELMVFAPKSIGMGPVLATALQNHGC